MSPILLASTARLLFNRHCLLWMCARKRSLEVQLLERLATVKESKQKRLKPWRRIQDDNRSGTFLHHCIPREAISVLRARYTKTTQSNHKDNNHGSWRMDAECDSHSCSGNTCCNLFDSVAHDAFLLGGGNAAAGCIRLKEMTHCLLSMSESLKEERAFKIRWCLEWHREWRKAMTVIKVLGDESKTIITLQPFFVLWSLEKQWTARISCLVEIFLRARYSKTTQSHKKGSNNQLPENECKEWFAFMLRKVHCSLLDTFVPIDRGDEGFVWK